MKTDNKLDNKDNIYIGFWARGIATLVDIILFSGLFILVEYIMTGEYFSKETRLLPTLIYFILSFTIVIYTVVKYGGTPGKMTMSIKIVNENQKHISTRQAIIRILPQELYCMFYLLRLLCEDNWAMNSFISIVLSLIGVISLVDIITVIFNKRKRALHDYLAKTYVVENEEFIEDEIYSESANN